MSNLRKLQTEIDRVMKKVDEGVDLFDEIWEKVYSAEQQNQKEKYEMDLKKEIKKLQRLRDQIKTWIGSSDVKDKDNLIEARKLIETKMEQFKICEKETKTKTYSKEGLARQEKLDPAEEARRKTTRWIGEYIEKFNSLVEDREVEIEKLSAGKGKKTNKHLIEEYNEFITNHKFHINKLEGIMRLVNNDRLDVELVDAVKEDIDYYLEAYEEDEFIQSYDEEYFYESLGLDELDVVNVDRVTNVSSGGKMSSTSLDDESLSSSKTGGKDKSSRKKSSAGGIPFTIGRARASSSGEKEKPTTPSKIGRATSSTSREGSNHSGVGLGPTPKAAPPVQTGGASMASILKREGEQEKERQKALQQQQLLREQQARAQQEQLRQQQLLRQQQEQAQQQLRQQEALRQQQQQKAAAQQEALKRQQIQLQEQQRAQQEAAAKQQQQQLQAQQQAAAEQKKLAQRAAQQQQSQSTGTGGLEILRSGLGGLSLGDQHLSENASPMPSLSAVSPQPQPPSSSVDTNAYLAALNESYANIPSGNDTERQRTYTPKNPYPTPSAYPSTPSSIFETPPVFEKLGTDCLFFIFYYSQGTYQQYLAARELKKQSWRYHKKYMTWFQRHEEPKVTTDEYEEGTYVYFDYESGWCQRIKHDFRFEYRFLEDSLA